MNPLPPLDAIEARVLGALIEKDLTTPDYYPLSLNALVNACNQINNREPVMALGEPDVTRALDKLRDKRLAVVITGGDSRVLKFAHKAREVFELSRPEVSLLCLLLLRGPQTVGELRGRSGRMHEFADLNDVQATLGRLAQRENPEQPALVALLPRAPGTKESRYAHLLSGEPVAPAAGVAPDHAAPVTPLSSDTARLAQLEADNADLKRQLADLRREFEDFRKKFE
ncbi:YceH family protein [Oleiharenicola sp. Vm1]|uniref:YceH family protein n=1 Tax=Oleiharenicola sp. Vm1 TaxID=3398393 RepID=UPI0039F50DD6